MGKKWIVGLMILTTLWAMTGCGKQEMIRCEYTNETAGFTLSIDRPVEWTAKLQEGWPATETEEASPDEGIRIYTDDSQESSIYFCNSFSPYYAGDENDLETVEVNEELTALHGIETSDEWVRESYVFKGEHGNRCRRHDDAAGALGQAKEHLERDRAAQDFGHGGGDRG